MLTATILITMAAGAIINAGINSACRAKQTREAKRTVVASAGMMRHIAAAVGGAADAADAAGAADAGDVKAPPAVTEGPAANPQ